MEGARFSWLSAALGLVVAPEAQPQGKKPRGGCRDWLAGEAPEKNRLKTRTGQLKKEDI